MYIAFVPFEHKQLNLLLPKLTFVFFNAVMLAAALYKFSSEYILIRIIHQFNLIFNDNIVMGIIPVAPIDWNGLISSKVPIEHSQVVMFNK